MCLFELQSPKDHLIYGVSAANGEIRFGLGRGFACKWIDTFLGDENDEGC
jgi:hypothetical protein